MNSALGNFNSDGIRQNDTQTPENGESLNATMQRLCSNLLSLQEILEKHTNASRVANVSQETYTNSTPVVSEATNDVINVLDYVSKAEWVILRV
jgi:hypothetical protein